ncbi:MAG: hypothetical protein ACOYYF_10460 [Chloroflexota bacterium]|nr:hypothetical protein [Chloroflexota bacterium]MBI5702879.1 hypothetical protein [Chloroflexota bacterium]
MDNTPLTKRPWLYIVGWLVFLLLFYGWQIQRMGGLKAHVQEVLFDLLLVFPLLLVLWLAFFSQFVLPVQTFRDRQKIFDRLLTYLFGAHGPAIFIRNGQQIKKEGEENKKGPGVVWLDSASAAVTYTATKIKQVLGPGVYFLDNGEKILSTVDLHYQVDTVGPREDEDPFAETGEFSKDENRRKVKALTRDGIEVVPIITVRFRVDTGYPREGKPGSRFGFRTGITKTAKENEKKDKDAIRKALLGEGINATNELSLRKMRWNELPGVLAVDVWREYAAKFTLDDFFDPKYDIPMPPPQPPQPAEEEIDPLTEPVLVSQDHRRLGDFMAQLLREVNKILLQAIHQVEGATRQSAVRQAAPVAAGPLAKREPQKGTALQVINAMVEMRLKYPQVPVLDDHGRLTQGSTPSQEYHLLKARGLVVDSVSVGKIRFNEKIEKTIIEKWATSWLKNAKDEEARIKRQQDVIKTAAHERAYRQYADRLSTDILRRQPPDAKEALKALLLRTRAIILTDDNLREQMKEEIEKLGDILRWVEEEE